MKLRDQLLYVKHFMNKDIDKKSLYISSNTVLKYKETLIGILELDKEKQDSWFPGEDVEILSNTSGLEYKINFMKTKRSNSNAFVCLIKRTMIQLKQNLSFILILTCCQQLV